MLASTCVAWLLVGISHYAQALHTSIDAEYKELSAAERQHAVPPRAYLSDAGSAVLPEVNKKGFWFSKFTVGAAKDYVMLIDSGSSDVYLNRDEYKPSKKSQNLHQNFSITFLTTKPNGSGSVTLSGPLYKDVVSSNGLTIDNQEMGIQAKPKKNVFPQNGLIGFAGKASSSFKGRPWIHSLCAEKKIKECRFGLAFNTNNKGTQEIGGVAKSKFKGSLSVAPIAGEWALYGDVTVNNKVFQKSAPIITDSGTTVIYGPLPIVRKIFKELGLQTSLQKGQTSYLRAFYPCDKTPTVGFAFPSAKNASMATGPVSKHSKNFNILSKPFAFKSNGHNNCTASLQGMEGPDLKGIWLVGQAFFQGHYIDHNIHDGTMGFADLK